MGEAGDRAASARPVATSTDALTGLLDAKGFAAVVSSAHAGRTGVVLVAGLDDFGAVNTAHGRERGDAVLRIAARRLAKVVRPDDVVGRCGGDEFAVFLPDADVYVAVVVAERMLEVLDDPIEVGGRKLRVGVSVGINSSATGPIDEQLATAGTALRRAKSHGRGRIEVARA